MHEPLITIIGNVFRVPKLRNVSSGAFVADFRVASTPRRLDKGTGEWSHGQTLWFGVTCWRSLAQNVAASLHTGDKVVVTGRLATRSRKGEPSKQRGRDRSIRYKSRRPSGTRNVDAVTESGLIRPVPSLTSVIGPWRVTVPSADGGGAPPHVTLLYTWLPAPTSHSSAQSFARYSPGPKPSRWPSATSTVSRPLFLTLTDEADSAVRAVTRQLVAAFPTCLPYGGEFPDPHPHLTVALGTHAELDVIQSAAQGTVVPIMNNPVTIADVTVMKRGTDNLWREAHHVRMGPEGQ